MNIISWNVLLRDYEEKYNPKSYILKKWNNEKSRIEMIINKIKENSNKDSIILLQEVSSNMKEKLSEEFSNKHMFSYLVRTNEYLISLVPSNSNFKEEIWKKNNMSNGNLIINNNFIRIINTHLIPQKYCNDNIMSYIINLPFDMKLIIAGDFNEYYKKVNNKLKLRYTVPLFGNTYKKKQIDHIIFDNDLEYKCTKIFSNNLSDHHLIKLCF